MNETRPRYLDRIVRSQDPRRQAGHQGTRIGVDLVLEERSFSSDVADLIAAHPDLGRADVQACVDHAQAIIANS